MMKKLLALILALSLCVSLTASLAESNAPLSGAFGRALQEWIQSLDPSSTDLRIDWTDGEKTSSAEIRGDNDLTLVEIPELGRIQISEGKIVLQLEGKTTVVDLNSLIRFQQSRTTADSRDSRLLSMLYIQAFEEVIMPSVKMRMGENGLVFHFSIDNQVLIRRLYDYLDKVFQSEAYRELILRSFSSFLASVPDSPKTGDELLSWWKNEYSNAGKAEKTTVLDLDVISNDRSAGSEIVGFGTLTSREVRFDFSFDSCSSMDGFTMNASVQETRRSRTVANCTISLRSHGTDLYIRSSAESESKGVFSFDLDVEDADIYGTVKNGDREYVITGSRNAPLRKVSVSIRRVGYEKDEGADFSLRPGQLDLNAFSPDRTLRCSVSYADSYGHIILRGTGLPHHGDFSCDLLATKLPEGGVRISLMRTGAFGWSRYDAEPGKILYETASGAYSIEKVKDTADTLVWEIRKNDEPVSVITALLTDGELGRVFSLTVERDGHRQMNLTVTPVEKEEIQPLDETDATVIDAEHLSPQPVQEGTP